MEEIPRNVLDVLPSADDDDDLDDDLDGGDAAQRPIKTTFELNDTLYAEAELEDTDTVYLWLGVRYLLNPCSSTSQVSEHRPMSCFRTRSLLHYPFSNQN